MNVFNVLINHLCYVEVFVTYRSECECVRSCVCHFIDSPESRWLARSMEGGGGRVSRGSSLIDVFWG